MKQQNDEIQKKLEALKNAEAEAGAGAAASLKTLGEFIQTMPPEDAADAIKEMVNDGKLDFVIQLLRKIEPRVASKFLAAIDDPALVAEIATRFSEVPNLK